MKMYFIAAALAAAIGTASPAFAAEARWEQTKWAVACETFRTPWAGIVPCDKAADELTITDGTMISFWYDDEQENLRTIFFNNYKYNVDGPPPPGVFRVTTVQDGALPLAYSRTDASGGCDMRDSGHFRCKVTTASG